MRAGWHVFEVLDELPAYVSLVLRLGVEGIEQQYVDRVRPLEGRVVGEYVRRHGRQLDLGRGSARMLLKK
jgi:hypothetical protein